MSNPFDRTTPFWPDACGHGGYLASFETLDNRHVRQFDVYVWGEGRRLDKVCLRYGPEDSEYEGYYSLVHLFRAAETNHIAREAESIVRHFGHIVFVPKTAEEDA
jgi:hypothetical protein